MTSRSLIGTELDQVPVNGMLGGLAYQSSENAAIKNLNLKNLTDIDTDINDTAVDVFVYDTSKDSDGGAWRYRTQSTSWYKETLNTATRGSRREFPSVAVVVVELFKLTIYDGDDPDLPMWMVFNADTSAWNTDATFLSLAYAPGSGMNLTSAACLNAKLVVTGSQHGLVTIDFINETQNNRRPDLSGSVAVHKKSGSISLRNDTSGQRLTTTDIIVNRFCNDVAITVLPNAPIDSTTGLPIPVIAVGTQGGVSVVREDGSVYDVTYSAWNNITEVFFTEDNLLAHLSANTVNQTYGFHYIKVPSEDFNNGSDGRNAGTHDVRFYNSDGRAAIPSLGSKAYGHSFIDGAVGFSGACPSCGLTLLEKDAPEDYENSSIAFVQKDYNTGWMHGDCKGAWLSDTDTTNIVGTNLATSFVAGGSNRLTSLNYNNGNTAWQMVDNAGSANGYININFTGLTVGKIYRISMVWDNNAPLDSGYEHRIAHLNGLAGENATNFTHWNKTNGSSETLTGLFTAQSVNDDDLIIYANAITLNISGFDVRELVEEDRSVNDDKLAAFGTLVRAPVEAGAELVGYSGWNSSNYLLLPNNSNLQFGTGDLYMIFWHKKTNSAANEVLFQAADTTTGGLGATLGFQHLNDRYYAYTTGGDGGPSGTNDHFNAPFVADGQWHCVAGVRSDGVLTIYVDGESIGSGVRNYNVNNTGDLTIGTYVGAGTATAQTSTMALLRIGGGAPSPEQIKKIYNEEKALFKENAPWQ